MSGDAAAVEEGSAGSLAALGDPDAGDGDAATGEGAEARRPSRALIGAGLALLTALVFFPAVRCDFVGYDDPRGTAAYAIVLRGLSWRGLKWAFSNPDYFANWLPLTVLSHMLDWQLFGANPAGHHVTSLLLHALTVALVFVVFARTTGRVGRAAAAALLWGLHPLRVEPVVWIAARKDMLSGCFAMLALLLYVRWTEERTGRRYLAVVAAYVAALLSKSMVMTLPLVMLLFDVWPLRRAGRSADGEASSAAPPLADADRGIALAWRSLWPLVREKVPLFALAAIGGAIAFFAQRNGGAMADLHVVPLSMRIASALLAVPRYLGNTFWPAGLTAFYPLDTALPPIGELVLAGALLVAVTAVVLVLRRSQPWLAVGWFWLLVMLLPVLGIVQVGDASHADRYTYLPEIGLFVAIVWTVGEALQRRAALRALAVPAVILLAVACAIGTRAQIRHWRTSEALFTRMIAVYPRNHVGHMNLGVVLEQQGRLDEAIAHYRAAVAARPELAMGWNNLGGALRLKRDYAGAEAALVHAIGIDPHLAGAHFNLAVVYEHEGKTGPAAGHLAEVIAQEPSYPLAWRGLRDILSRPGGIAQARPWILAVARAEPESHELQQLAAGLRTLRTAPTARAPR